jgi:transposase-like protein
MSECSKRFSYDAATKLRIIKFAEEKNNCAAAREFGVAESNVRLWRKQKSQIQKMPKTKQASRGKQALYPEMERDLVTWVEHQRNDGYIVTCLHLRLQARKIMKDPKYGVPATFKASNGWCQRFMKRHCLSVRQKTKISQKMPDELEDKITNFQRFVIDLRKVHHFEISQIGNMDETPMCFDMPGNRTLDKVGNKTVFVRTTGHEKTHFTVVLCCLADGTKLQPMVIFKRKTIPKNETFPSGVIVHCHSKGWMDEAGILLWLEKVWGNRPGGLLLKPAMLVWDQFRAHLTDPVKKKLNELRTHQAVIPGMSINN